MLTRVWHQGLSVLLITLGAVIEVNLNRREKNQFVKKIPNWWEKVDVRKASMLYGAVIVVREKCIGGKQIYEIRAKENRFIYYIRAKDPWFQPIVVF